MFRNACAIAMVWICSVGAVSAASPVPLPPQLQVLNKAVGKWVYHGKNVQSPLTKAGNWTWNVDCAWSSNHAFLLCSFDMDWPEGPDRSIAIATYNKLDKSYWHYEVIDDVHGNKPFVSRLTIAGDTWIESFDSMSGKAADRFRVVYHYTSPTTAAVMFQTSKDALHWVTIGRGEGIKP